MWDCASGDFALDDEFSEEFGEVVPHLWIDIQTDEAEMGFDAFLEFERFDQIQHEGDLIEDLGEEVDAELGKGFVAEVASAVVVTVAWLIGFLEVLVVGGSGSCESPGEGVEAFGIESCGDHGGLGLEAGDAAVAVTEGVDPRQAVMGCGKGDQSICGGKFCVGIEGLEALEEFLQGGVVGRCVFSHIDVVIP